MAFYKLWFYTKDLPLYRISVDWIYEKIFGITDNVWDDNILSNYHKSTIDKADLRYPILLYKKSYENIDGEHRIAKAKLLKRKYILYKSLPNRILNKCKINNWGSSTEYESRFIEKKQDYVLFLK